MMIFCCFLFFFVYCLFFDRVKVCTIMIIKKKNTINVSIMYFKQILRLLALTKETEIKSSTLKNSIVRALNSVRYIE